MGWHHGGPNPYNGYYVKLIYLLFIGIEKRVIIGVTSPSFWVSIQYIGLYLSFNIKIDKCMGKLVDGEF